jgi:PDZ domain-containing secreted protein
MWIVIGIIVLAILAFVAKIAYGARTSGGRQYSDEELKNMSFEDWTKLSIEGVRGTGTDVLRIHLRQYEDLKKHIDSHHPGTVRDMTDQSKQRSLASLEHVKAELKRRGAI